MLLQNTLYILSFNSFLATQTEVLSTLRGVPTICREVLARLRRVQSINSFEIAENNPKESVNKWWDYLLWLGLIGIVYLIIAGIVFTIKWITGI